MFEAAAVVAVLAGVGVGWLLARAPRGRRAPAVARWVGRRGGVDPRDRVDPRRDLAAARRAQGSPPRARPHARDLAAGERDQRLGGSHHVLDCGQPVTDVGYVSTLAWLYHIDVGSVGGLQQHVEAAELRQPGDSEGAVQAAVPGRVECGAVAHAAVPDRALRRTPRHLHEQRRADPALAVATTEQRPSPAPAGAGSGGRNDVLGPRTPACGRGRERPPACSSSRC